MKVSGFKNKLRLESMINHDGLLVCWINALVGKALHLNEEDLDKCSEPIKKIVEILKPVYAKFLAGEAIEPTLIENPILTENLNIIAQEIDPNFSYDNTQQF
jgi:hypothetical protein